MRPVDLAAKRSTRILLLLALLYLLITIAGLFPFRGIPILNVALGFPIGAAVAYRSESQPALLRTLVTWALVTAGITMLVCWVELVFSLLTIKFLGPFVASTRWTPLVPSTESPNLFRAQLFAVIISPGLQVLTTVFGGVITLLIAPRR